MICQDRLGIETIRKIERQKTACVSFSPSRALSRSLAGTGFGAGIILTICEVDLAPLFGLLAFLFNFIPIVGSVIATFLPLPIVLFQPDMTLCVRKLRQHHSHTALPFLALVFSLPSNCSLSVSQVTDSPLYCLRCACVYTACAVPCVCVCVCACANSSIK